MRGEASEMSSTCIQSVVPPMARFQPQASNPLAGQSPEPAWQYNSSIINMKQEPLDEARNDSGVTSGSDCPSASPGSDRSDNHPYGSQENNMAGQAMGNGHFVNTQIPYHTWYRNNFVTSPTSGKDQEHASDEVSSQAGYQNSASPKIESGDENSVEYDEQGIRVPKVNSHGKIKVHKCKQCDFVAYTKLDFWEHSKVHIKGDKILKCPRCPFVTEYKHHLEYHLLNHAGAKPFKCDHCDYSCVNKSMLNSHLKSHSKIYQYRCSDCLYETKYCHSLKLHLRKYKHKPAMVLNPDGSPNPLPIIDVYGTRRGPKVKKTSESSNSPYPATSTSPGLEPPPSLPFNPMMNPLLNQNPMLPFPLPLMPGFPGVIPNPDMIQNFQKIIRERLEELAKQNEVKPELREDGVLDLSSTTKPASHSSEDGDSDDDERMTTAFDNVEVVETKSAEAEHLPTPEISKTIKEQSREANNNASNNNKYEFACQYCGICFGEEVMYRIHMGYHGYSNPFTCNMCGEECENKVNFFLHIARAAH